MKNLKYNILHGLLKAAGTLPLGFHYGCGKVLSWVAAKLVRYRRDVVMTNLSRSFPEKKYNELKVICRDFYRHLGEIFAEAVWFGGCTDPERLRKQGIVKMTNPEVLNDLYERTGSVFVLTSHSGNWELIGGYVSYAPGHELKVPENDVCVVYKHLTDDAWDRIMQKNRTAPIVDKEHYDGMVETYNIMRYMLTHRSEKKVYNFITDQHPYKGTSSIDVGSFMNQDTKSMDGGAKLASRFGMSVVYMNMKPESRGHYTMTFTPICEDASTMSVEDIMKQYYSLLQRDIEETPWNYLWSHKRWK